LSTRVALLAALLLLAVTGGFAAYAVFMLPDVDPWHTIDLHDEMRAEVAAARAEIRDRIEATPRGGTAYIRNRVVPGFGWLPETTTPLPGLAGLFVIESPSDEVDGRVVRFVEPDQAVRALATRHGKRLAHLLVPSGPPGDVSSVVGPLSAARCAAPACRP